MTALVDYAWTDAGNAERLVALHGRDLRYVRTWGKWLAFDGRRWVQDDAFVYQSAKATAREMLRSAAEIEDHKERGAFASFATKTESRRGLEAMVALARHEQRISVTHTDLDDDPWLLNVANGTVDLRTGELRHHRREDLITRIAPVAYDVEAEAPTWQSFLRRAMADDPELLDYLRRLAGYAITGVTREHVLAFLFGGGANGKSTFTRTMHEALGEYATPAPRGLLFRSRGERPPH